MPYFFIDKDFEIGDMVRVSAEDHHHLARVHRYRVGDVVVFNSEHYSYNVKISTIEKDCSWGSVYSKDKLNKTPVIVTAGIPLLKSGNTELALQKCTELGIDNFFVIDYERSVPEIKSGTERLARWQRVVREAAKQCMRSTVPDIHGIVSSVDFFKRSNDFDRCLILDLEGSRADTDYFKVRNSICFAAGPEGGYSQRERSLALDSGWEPCRFNGNQLRAETAVIAFASLVSSALFIRDNTD